MTQVLHKCHLIVKMPREKFDMINVLSSSFFPTLIKQKATNPVAYTAAINNKRVISAKFSPRPLRKTFHFTHFALQIIKGHESETGSDLQRSVKSVSLLAGRKIIHGISQKMRVHLRLLKACRKGLSASLATLLQHFMTKEKLFLTSELNFLFYS